MKHLVLTLAVVCLAAATSQAALLVEESFDYTIGDSLVGQSGGTGFSGAWLNANNSNRSFPSANPDPSDRPNTAGPDIVDGLSYGPLVVSGGAAYFELGQTGVGWSPTKEGEAHKNDSAKRSFASSIDTDNTVWTSMLIGLDDVADPSFGNWAGAKFTNNYWFGRNAGQSNWGMEKPKTETSIGIGKGDTFLLVMALSPDGAGNYDKHLWVNPAFATLGGPDLDFGTADLSNSQTAASFSQILGDFAAAGTWDEFRVGDTYADVTPVPEPGVMMLLATGLTAVYGLRRRRG